MSEALRGWLSHELDQRRLSQRELARQTGVSQTLVSQILSGDRNPGADFCVKVAGALGESPIKLLRLADILPAAQGDPALQEIIDLAENLTPEQRRQVLDFIKFIYGRD